MSSNNQAHTRSCWHQGKIQAIEEGAARSTLGMGGLLIWRLPQPGLNSRQIEQAIVFSAYDHPHPTGEQLRQRSSIPIQSIQACAAVRGLISPVQPGRTRKEVLESPCLPGAKRRRETQHAWEVTVCVKTLRQSWCKIRTPRLKLDCLKSNRQLG